MSGAFCNIDDKHVPIYRIVWISDIPHFCGNDDCMFEGRYEVRLEMDESVFASREERDDVLVALEAWAGGRESESEDEWQ